MNFIIWLTDFILVFDFVALGCMIMYLTNRLQDRREPHYTLALAAAIFLVGKTIVRIATWWSLFHYYDADFKTVTAEFPGITSVGYLIGTTISALGAVLIIRLIGVITWRSEWLWIITTIVAALLPFVLQLVLLAVT